MVCSEERRTNHLRAAWSPTVIQLKGVAIWNREGERRTIELRPGELNIITGEAKTGKSALLEIVEFCLGRNTVSLPEGVVTRSVDWYGLIVVVGDHSVFIGRPGPRTGQATVSGAHLALGGPDLAFPDHGELEVNSNADSVTEYLTRVTGIGEYENVPPVGATRPPLRPTVRHASLFCFQRQNEIANPRQLFHRQEEDFMPQAIKDTLPYFLGAVDREAPTLRSRLHQLRREFRQAERRLEESRRVQLRAPTRSVALLAEAVDSGLVASPAEETADPIQLLREALEAPTEPALGEETSESEYRRLAQQSQELTSELRAIGERAEALRVTTSDQADYRSELREQAARLESINILPAMGGESDLCPICGSAIEEADATIGQLIEAANETRTELSAAAAAEPARRDALSELEARAEELRQRLREVHGSLAALSRDRDRIRSFREAAMARAYVKGRIVQHLEQLEQAEEIPLSDLEVSVERLRREIEELDDQLDPETERQQVVSRLNVIGDDMTAWAERLQLEHVGGRARIDAAQLTVVVDTTEGPIPLERMGSASNWVGYHLVAHLALHKWFALHDRPVPRFLMLDQPTQAFYPPDVTDMAAEDLSDDDRASVEAMFALTNDLVRELTPAVQIVVMDHANLLASWFQDSVVEVWRGGNKLVPMEWLANNSRTL
jgi:predicted  nucleic acid-binding Zn-ribbon protein